VMSEMGKAMMGTGEAEGDRRAIDAAEAAISNPLLEDVSMKGARGVLINITGGPDMTLFEVDEAANRIREEVDPDANIIFGSTFEENLAGRMRISVVATGIEVDKAAQPRPLISLVSDRSKPEAPAKPAAPAPASASISASFVAPPAASPVEIRAAEPRLPEPPRIEPKLEPKFEPKLEPKPEHKVEPVLPQAHTIEAQAMAKDVFIAPRPIEAAVRPAAIAQPAPAPDALAAAAMENGGRPPQKVSQRVPSLFERVTKAGRLLHREEPEPPARTAAPAAAQAPAPAPVVAPVQPKLGALDPAERPGAKEEDLLDIPAFLRRQAN